MAAIIYLNELSVGPMSFLNIAFWLLVGFVIGWFLHSWQTGDSAAPSELAVESAQAPVRDALRTPGGGPKVREDEPLVEDFRKQLASGNTAETVKIYSGAASRHPDVARKMSELLVNQAERLIRQRQRDRAYELITGYLAKDPYNPRALLVQARLELLRRQYQQALEKVLEAKTYAAGEAVIASANALLQKITSVYERVLREQKRWPEMAALFSNLLEKDPAWRTMHGYYKLGEAQYRQGKFYEAIATLERTSGDATVGRKAQNLAGLIEQLIELGDGTIAIPVENTGSHFLVDVTLNSGKAAKLLIDTGASVSLLKMRFADRVGLPEEGAEEGKMTIHTASDTKTIKTTELDKFEIGGIVFSGLTVGIAEMPEGGINSDGLLGMDVLSHFKFYLDQENATLFLSL